MNNLSKKIFYPIVSVLSILIGFYPATYFFLEKTFGLLGTKPPELLDNQIWNTSFYGHIILGGLALLIGWVQFSEKLRVKNIALHRKIGKVYMISVLISGICGIYIGFHATGGSFSAAGFISLGIVWLYTTVQGFFSARKGNIAKHQQMMIYSYAACFAAVTLRIWLPILVISMGDFIAAYKVVAWLCWVPNLFVAYLLTRRQQATTS